MANTYDKRELSGSRPAERAESRFVENPQEISLANVKSTDGRARAWRVTLSRLDRNDRRPMNHINDPANSSPAWISQLFSYTAGFQTTPALPPRRSEPIFGVAGSAPQPVWVEIFFGQETATPNRMLANWPALGGSVVVYGSFVDVFGGVQAPTIDRIPGDFPSLQAVITPAEGLSQADSGELSIQQEVFIEGITELDATLNTLDIQPTTLKARDAFDTEHEWTATLTYIGPGDGNGKLIRIYVDTQSGVAGPGTIFVVDDSVWDPGTMAFVPELGTVGVYVQQNTPALLTIADLEAAINASSVLVQVTTPDVAHATDIISSPGGPPAMRTGTFLDGVTNFGAVVYVPDFARRVRVTTVDFDDELVPATGEPIVQMVWYDDFGFVVDAALHGTAGMDPFYSPDLWYAVPARAVLLAFYSLDGAENCFAHVHWRIAP